jgi:hypothetical protein
MNDHIAGEDLAAYADGALKGEAKAAAEAHLCHCPECLEALADIVFIREQRAKIPAEFLRRALTVPGEGAWQVPAGGIPGGKKVPSRPLVPMRLVFGVAAVLLVALMLGYFFLGGNRSPRSGGAREERSDLAAARSAVAKMEKAQRPAQVPLGRGGAAAAENDVKARSKRLKKEAPLEPAPAGKLASPAEAPSTARPLLADGEPEAAHQQELLAGGAQVRQEKDKSAAPNLAAAPAAAPRPGAADYALKGENGSRRQPAGTEGAAAEAVQIALAVSGRAAAPMRIRLAELPPASRIRINGDVSRADLRNPALLDEWSWFPDGGAIELAIAGDGRVSAVSLTGRWEASAAALARGEAAKLLFSASDAGLRRALLTRVDAPLN